jgi:hypothetical protein
MVPCSHQVCGHKTLLGTKTQNHATRQNEVEKKREKTMTEMMNHTKHPKNNTTLPERTNNKPTSVSSSPSGDDE